MTNRLGESVNDVSQPLVGGGHCLPHLANLPVVFDKAELAHHLGEAVIRIMTTRSFLVRAGGQLRVSLSNNRSSAQVGLDRVIPGR
jgi:hypothetical protein